MKSLSGTSATSVWQILGSLFVATVVGLLLALLAKSYIEKHDEWLFASAFLGGYLWKKVLDKIEKTNFKELFNAIRGVKK